MHKFEARVFPDHFPEFSEVPHAGLDFQRHQSEEFQCIHEGSDAVETLLVRADLHILVSLVDLNAVVKGLVEMGSLENTVSSDPTD